MARWSPDSTMLAFTENVEKRADEPDVWVFDVFSGELRDLTEDEAGADTHTDVLPSWSPDGTEIWFARGGETSTRLMSVPVDGGPARRLGEIDCGVGELTALAWSAEHVAWTCGAERVTVWLAGHDGIDPQRVVEGGWGEDWRGLSFSPDGQWLLADTLGQYRQWDTNKDPLPEDAGGAARVIPAGGGDPVPLAAGRVGFPTWSPQGHALVYVELPATLKLLPEPNGRAMDLAAADEVVENLRTADTITAGDGVRLNWVPGKLIAAIDGKPTLLSLTGSP